MLPITLPALALRTALAGLVKAVNRRCTLPVLGYLKVERRNGVVHLTGTDLDLFLTFSHPTEPPPITKLGKSLAALRWEREATNILVPLDAAKHAAKSASGEEPWVTLTLDTVSWSTPGGAVSMPFSPLPAKEFPDSPTAPFCTIAVDEFTRSTLLQAEKFSSEDETRYVLNGVLLETVCGDSPCPPTIVATDGRRLFRCIAPGLAGLNGNVVLPNKALVTLSAAPLLSHDWRLGANAAKFRAAVKAGPWTLLTKTIEGNYPAYRQVIPSDFTHWITVSLPPSQVGLFIAALEQLPATNRPAIALLFHGDHLRLHCPASDTSVVVPGVRSDAPLAVLFDRHLIRDLLRCGPGTLFLQDDASPCFFAAASGAEHVLMPYRGESKFSVPDPDREALEAVWKDCRISITELGEGNESPTTSEGAVLRVLRQGLRLDSAVVQFDGEQQPCTVPIADLTLLPSPTAEQSAAA